MKQNGNYVNGVGYALAKLGAVAERLQLRRCGSSRLAGLGHATSRRRCSMIDDRGDRPRAARAANVAGFITNTANTSALQEPYITVDSTTRPSTLDRLEPVQR